LLDEKYIPQKQKDFPIKIDSSSNENEEGVDQLDDEFRGGSVKNLKDLLKNKFFKKNEQIKN